MPPILVEKHKVLQILVNLIRNAKHACDDSGESDKQITLRVAKETNSVKISVSRQRRWHSRGKHDPGFQPWIHHQKKRPWFRPSQRRLGRQRNGRKPGCFQRRIGSGSHVHAWNCPSSTKPTTTVMIVNPNNNHRILVIDDNKAIHEDFRKILARPKATLDSMDEAEAVLFERRGTAG